MTWFVGGVNQEYAIGFFSLPFVFKLWPSKCCREVYRMFFPEINSVIEKHIF